MAEISVMPLEDVLRPARSAEPSERTIATREAEEYAEQLYATLTDADEPIAAVEDLSDKRENFVSGVRSALRRLGYDSVMLRTRPKHNQMIAWLARPEDQKIREKKAEVGARLGQLARERAGHVTPAGPPARTAARAQTAAPVVDLKPSRNVGHRATGRVRARA